MIAFTHSIDIHRPIDEVFAFLGDFTNIRLWNYYVLDVQQHTPGPVTVGTVYQQVRRHDQQRYHVTVHQSPHSIGVATLPGERPAFDRHLHLEPVGDATTRVQDNWELDTGHPQALQPRRRTSPRRRRTEPHDPQATARARRRLPPGRTPHHAARRSDSALLTPSARTERQLLTLVDIKNVSSNPRQPLLAVLWPEGLYHLTAVRPTSISLMILFGQERLA